MSGEYQRAIRDPIPAAEICFDPLPRGPARRARPTRSAATHGNAHERSHTRTGRLIKGTRCSLLKARENEIVGPLATRSEIHHANRQLYRAFLLREEPRPPQSRSRNGSSRGRSAWRRARGPRRWRVAVQALQLDRVGVHVGKGGHGSGGRRGL